MNPFLRFLYDNPFFAACFVFHTIPFWVPLLAVLYGADPVLMLALSALSVTSRAYIYSEVTASNPIDTMFSYFFTVPFLAVVRFLFTAAVIALLVVYALSGSPLDGGIAAVMIVFAVKVMYFRPKTNLCWNISGLGMHRLFSITGKLLAALIWLSVLTLPLGAPSAVAAGFAAVFIGGFTFYKTNEGLL